MKEKGKTKQKKTTRLLLLFPLLSHTLNNSSADSSNKTAIPYEMTDESVENNFTLLKVAIFVISVSTTQNENRFQILPFDLSFKISPKFCQ